MSATVLEAAPPSSAATISGRARTIALICLLAASFMELMDATVVNVSLSTIRHDLGASSAQMQWVVAGYPLAFAVCLIIGARLGDRFGRRRVFLAGLIGFGLMSLACGIAANPEQLVAFRILQGVAAAAMVPQVLTSLQVMYRPEERGTAMGAFTAVIGLAAVTGPVVGALLTQWDLGGLQWRPIFLVNVPIAVIAVIAARALVPESRADHPAPITGGSAGLLGASLGAIVLPITLGPDNDWPAWGFVLAAAGVVGLIAFAYAQLRTERRGIEALVPPSLFATPSFSRGIVAFLALSIPTGGFFLIQSIHVQAALGWSVLRTGLAWVPFSLAVPIAAGLAATKLAEIWGRKVLQGGAAIFIAGIGTMIAAEGTAQPAVWFVPAYFLAGLGFGAIIGAAGLLVLKDVPVRSAGAASGVFNTTQALSVAVGAAVFGTLYSAIGNLHDAYALSMAGMAGLVALGGVLAGLMPRIVSTVAPVEQTEDALVVA
ncbi:MFS transporter [Jongsikchunia kroppenstedtii]|uniref:MFS transporter n=1 Tax=Jongsikchunia kroppenstedtii TaxID=1121721 RepID=UPI00035F8A7B|nr:MFS transporter [Jongsikchunia kroppenstedtii]